MRLKFSTKQHWRYFWFQTSLLYMILSDLTYRLFLHTIQSTKSCALHRIPLYYSIHLTPNNTKTSDSNYKHFLSSCTELTLLLPRTYESHGARERTKTIINHHWMSSLFILRMSELSHIQKSYELWSKYSIYFCFSSVNDAFVFRIWGKFSHTHTNRVHIWKYFSSVFESYSAT